MNIVIVIKVIPQSGKQKLWRDKSGIIKCAIKSAPERGRANEELIQYLENLLKKKDATINIIRGKTDRTKTISIQTTTSIDDIYHQLGIEIQAPIKL